MIRHWTAPHPDWEHREVASYRVGDLLIDPLAPPEDALDGVTAIVLTSPWHERDARAVAARLGVTVYVPAPEEGEPIPGRELYTAGDRLLVGVVAYPGREPNDLVLWLEEARAVVIGDTLIDRGGGLEIPVDWLETVTPAQIADGLRPLLGLPIEIVLPTHGAPTDRATLERALDQD